MISHPHVSKFLISTMGGKSASWMCVALSDFQAIHLNWRGSTCAICPSVKTGSSRGYQYFPLGWNLLNSNLPPLRDGFLESQKSPIVPRNVMDLCWKPLVKAKPRESFTKFDTRPTRDDHTVHSSFPVDPVCYLSKQMQMSPCNHVEGFSTFSIKSFLQISERFSPPRLLALDLLLSKIYKRVRMLQIPLARKDRTRLKWAHHSATCYCSFLAL